MVTATSATAGANIDVASIVSQLMAVERRPISKLLNQEASYQAKLSSFGTLKSAVSAFQTALKGLSANSFQAIKATPSDATIFSASASGTAAPGTYSLAVTSLAQAQNLVAAGQSSTSAAIGSGVATTLTFDTGTINGTPDSGGVGFYDPLTTTYTSNGTGTKTVTIDATNNSLQGIRDAINSANVGVTASIVNDGSGTPYRLTLTSSSTGVSNSMKISVAGDATLSGLLSYDPAGTQNLSQTAAAQNANFTVNGVAASKSSNTISDVIQGVTLNLNKTTTTPASLTVAQDTASVSTAISDFVSAYNALNSTIKISTSYDPATKTGGPLLGDPAVRTLQSRLNGLLSQPVSGATGGITSIAQIGITRQKDGSLGVDSTKLNAAMASNFNDIASLFAATGSATDSLVTFNSAGTNAIPGTYALNVSQLATQGSVVGNAVANTTITAGANDTLDLTINGVNASIVLAAGTYTAQSLAAQVQTQLNGLTALSSVGVSVAVTQNAGVLSITSANYGSSSSVVVAGGNAAAGLLGATPVQTTGVDVVGTINGVAATGSGQKITDANGLSFNINGGALGARGTVSYSQGIAYLMDQLATDSLSTSGALTSRTDSINKLINDSSDRRAAMEVRMTRLEANYRRQFTSLDVMLSSMNQTSLYLTQQLAKM